MLIPRSDVGDPHRLDIFLHLAVQIVSSAMHPVFGLIIFGLILAREIQQRHEKKQPYSTLLTSRQVLLEWLMPAFVAVPWAVIWSIS